MARCAKSWHTPRRCSTTTSSGVVTAVATGSYLKSLKIRPFRSSTPTSSGVSFGKLGDAEVKRGATLDGGAARLDSRGVVRNGHRFVVIVRGAVADGVVHFSSPRPVREIVECAK